MANFEWSRDGHYNANELAAVDPLAVLIRSHPWVFYGGRGKSTFSRKFSFNRVLVAVKQQQFVYNSYLRLLRESFLSDYNVLY